MGTATKHTKTQVDLASIVKCNDPYQPERVVNTHKWDQLFEGVKEGDCFRVHGTENQLGATARALRMYLKRKGIEGIVRQQARTKDGIGRVWLVKIISHTTIRGNWPKGEAA